MSQPQQVTYTSQQLQAALETAYESMLAFKRYKKTPVVIVRDGQVVEVMPDSLPSTTPKAA
ncbi:hypothetical protein [Hymenobacter chitinivorans]|uniref:Uncharacterized protein n=1 Tax=Hymenobacter chitinivorans DSM 11115 TaxID=1121954 RepID=A0A2M9BAU0_9BACT|nr:hypothetical protein [Hymenobacter chitinivorans]PJJ55049.1 hypothetical protein CLV45_3398 [Hymenobacter chitinivorans DSM 11115]